MKFLPLFEMNITHDYYASGACPDFSIEPTPATVAGLKNYRCVFKQSASGVSVFVSVDDQSNPFIPIPPGTTFIFQMRLTNSRFAMFTDLSDRPSPPPAHELWAYTNTTFNGKESLRFESVMKLEPQPEYLKKLLRFKDLLKPVQVRQIGDSLDNTDENSLKPSGFELLAAGLNPAPKGGAFAHIVIKLNGALPQPNDQTPVFEIPFTAKQARWEYFVVTDRNGQDLEVLDIQGANGLKPLAFDKSIEIPDPPTGVWEKLARQYPEATKIRFQSRAPIPAREVGRKNLQLREREQFVIDNLPNPSPVNYAATTVEINGQTRQEDSWFEIIPYFKQPFSVTAS